MEGIQEHIAQIKNKVQQLGTLYQSALEENKALKDINHKLKESLKQVSGEKEQLESELRELMETQKARQGDELSDYKKSFTKELDRYLKELNKCIELVENS